MANKGLRLTIVKHVQVSLQPLIRIRAKYGVKYKKTTQQKSVEMERKGM